MAWRSFGLEVSVDMHQVKQTFQVLWMALHSQLVLRQKHVPPFQEGQLISRVLNLFTRDLVLGFQGRQQDTLQVVFVAETQDIVHVKHQQTFASTCPQQARVGFAFSKTKF
jgi:hypothetical protein